MRTLVIAPHPDDEVLGCGGTISKLSESCKVDLCIVTSTYSPKWSDEFREKRREEINESADVLGVEDIFRLDLPTVKLDDVSQKKINDKISEVIEEQNPERVFIPHHSDLHKDHRIIHESALVACRPQSGVKKVLAYETLSETEWGTDREGFKPNLYMDIEKKLEDKLEAMSAYESEVKDPPHPRNKDTIEALAKKRGSEAHLKSAEAFEIVREIK